jgi:hypothetical protein
VTDGPNVDVWFGANEFLFGHEKTLVLVREARGPYLVP